MSARAGRNRSHGGDTARIIEDLRREREQLREALAEKDREIAQQQERIEKLERELAARKRNSTNSSKPPSSDGLAGKQRQRHSNRKKSGKKPGGQPGHDGQERPLVDNPDRVEQVLPAECKHCGTPLPQQADPEQVMNVFRRQIVELPEVIVPVVSEYQYPKLKCPCCQKGTRAPLLPEHLQMTGERLTAVISYLMAVLKMTRRDTQTLLKDLWGVDISVGSVRKGWEETAGAVQAPYEELAEALPTEPVVNGDETGSRTNGDKRWVWVMCTPWFVLFHIARSRGVEVLVELLGEAFAGILCSDRCPSYLSYHKGLAQFCWAHLHRSLKGIQESARSPEAVHFARDMLAAVGSMFTLWHRFRGEGESGKRLLTRKQLRIKSIPIQKKICQLAAAHLDSGNREVRNLARAFHQHWDKLFVFLEHEGVEPANNVSERNLRHYVLIRKITYGNRSGKGEVALSRLLTVTQTCKLQERPVLGYLQQALHCHRRRQPAPSLRPLQTQHS